MYPLSSPPSLGGIPAYTTPDLSLQFPYGPPVSTSTKHLDYRKRHGTVKATEQQRQLFVWLNYVMRPPLLNEEILAMPISDVVSLYYSARIPAGCGGNFYKSDKVISNGIPRDYLMSYGLNLQQRIYSLRNDLRLVQDPSGNTYRILLSPHDLDIQACDETANAIQFATVVATAAFGGIGGLIGTIISTIITTGSTVATVLHNRSIIEAINSAQGTARELLIGIALAQACEVQQPRQIDSQIVSNLSAGYQFWQSIVEYLQQDYQTIISWWSIMPKPEQYLATKFVPDVSHLGTPKAFDTSRISSKQLSAMISAGYQHKAEQYASYWSAYQRFFYSDAVAQMISRERN